MFTVSGPPIISLYISVIYLSAMSTNIRRSLHKFPTKTRGKIVAMTISIPHITIVFFIRNNFHVRLIKEES